MNNTLVLLFILFTSVVYLIFLILPKKARPFCLLIFSILFYVIYSKFMTIFLLTTIVTIYLGGFGINKLNDKFALKKEGLEKEERKKLKQKFNRKKFWLAFSVIFLNIAILAVLKYFNSFSSMFEGVLSWFNVSANMPILKLVLPLGISYYTLTSIGYLVDVYRGKYRAGNFWQVALFISYFPHLFEGPFAQFDKLSPQLQDGRGGGFEGFFSGSLTMLWGWTKKVVIADRLAIVASNVFANYSQYNGIVVIIGIVLFTFQLYAEFSGLIDVARGISKMFGIELAKNFNQPFFSQNVNEFWRRWHISLGAWLKDYIFYPISMSKGMMKLNKKLQGKVSTFWQVFIPSSIALLAVWVTNGIWHGAGIKYLVYGLYYYFIMMIGMCFEPLLNKIYNKSKINRDALWLKILRITRTFILVNIGMMIFRASSLTTFGDMFASIFTGGEINLIKLGVIDLPDVIVCVIGILTLIIVDVIKERKVDICGWFKNQHLILKSLVLLGFVLIIVIFGAYGNGYIPPDPIYGAF